MPVNVKEKSYDTDRIYPDYLSRNDVCRHLRFSHAPQHLGRSALHRIDAELGRPQLRGVQSQLYPEGHDGYIFTLFAIAIAAAESAIAIAIMINIYRMIKNIQVGELEKMKW